jgi:hypothetical protein
MNNGMVNKSDYFHLDQPIGTFRLEQSGLSQMLEQCISIYAMTPVPCNLLLYTKGPNHSLLSLKAIKYYHASPAAVTYDMVRLPCQGQLEKLPSTCQSQCAIHLRNDRQRGPVITYGKPGPPVVPVGRRCTWLEGP